MGERKVKIEKVAWLESDKRIEKDMNERTKESNEIRCYKCGGKLHISRECRKKSMVCFKCRKIEHISSNCISKSKCMRCGRYGLEVKKCQMDGRNTIRCNRCRWLGHSENEC